MKSGILVVGGVLLAAAAAAGIWAWAPDRPRGYLEKKYSAPSTEYMEIAASLLRVRATGATDAPAVILLHGFGSSLETWEPWAVALSARFRVVRFDFPGCGLSGPDLSNDYSDSRSTTIIRELMDRLGIRRTVLIGNSMGGRIAWRFAAEYPDRVSKLVLISPDGFASPGFEYGKAPKVPALLHLMKYFLPRGLMRMNLATAYADPARLTDPVVDRYYDLLLARGNRGAMIDRMQQNILQDPIPLLKQISTPTLLLWGKQDHLIPYANAADYLSALPNSGLVTFADLGHLPHEEAPAESLKPVDKFLAE